MIRIQTGLTLSLFFIIILSNLVQLALSTTMNFTVPAGGKKPVSINLSIEDHVVIKFSVIGQTANRLNFSMTYPNGTVKDFGETGFLNYAFVCDDEGEYVLHFSNVDSSEDKLVTLDYEVQHYIFGIPQMLFLTLIIVLVCMVAVAAFVLMGKPH